MIVRVDFCLKSEDASSEMSEQSGFFFVSSTARIRIDRSLRHSRQEAFKLNKKKGCSRHVDS